MGTRTPKLVLPVPNGSSSHSADVNASIILMLDGLDIPGRGGGAVGYSVRLAACGRLGARVRISAACNRPKSLKQVV